MAGVNFNPDSNKMEQLRIKYKSTEGKKIIEDTKDAIFGSNSLRMMTSSNSVFDQQK